MCLVAFNRWKQKLWLRRDEKRFLEIYNEQIIQNRLTVILCGTVNRYLLVIFLLVLLAKQLNRIVARRTEPCGCFYWLSH